MKKNDLAALLFILAAIVALLGSDGWGWLMLIGALILS